VWGAIQNTRVLRVQRVWPGEIVQRHSTHHDIGDLALVQGPLTGAVLIWTSLVILSSMINLR
jgi:hypothetical protein